MLRHFYLHFRRILRRTSDYFFFPPVGYIYFFFQSTAMPDATWRFPFNFSQASRDLTQTGKTGSLY